MPLNKTNLRDLKKLRLEHHWSQEQLADMSGLNIRTIQRVENGENASLETLKALASVFEINIANSERKNEIAQIRKEEEYYQKVKGFYKFLFIAIFSLIVPFILAIYDSSLWIVFFWILLSWVVILGIYSVNSFDFFGKDWKRKLIQKKFRKN
jgi:transcriptional regulator with XRE-family HTH domain